MEEAAQKEVYTKTDLLQKYRKPFTGMSTGKNIVLNELYKTLDDGGAWALPDDLYSDETIINTIYGMKSEKERQRYVRYVNASRWVTITNHSTKLTLETTNAYLFYHMEVLSSTIKSEMIQQDLTLLPKSAERDPRFEGQQMTELAQSLLTSADLTRFAEGKPDRFNITHTWETIRDNLSYLQAFNAAVELVAEKIRIPEFKAYCIDTFTPHNLIRVMSESLKTLDDIAADKGDALRMETLTLLHSLYDAAEVPISDQAMAKARKMLQGLAVFTSTDNNLVDTLLTYK